MSVRKEGYMYAERDGVPLLITECRQQDVAWKARDVRLVVFCLHLLDLRPGGVLRVDEPVPVVLTIEAIMKNNVMVTAPVDY